ncbi:hypothetical protein B0E52_06570 [Rhodanobacter sp. C06]|uniref:hypothetical protein n=1 Tax=Rhodanobacter sp. C06 TaxID=1945854 RepID=UPI0009873A07|nr:hypothetical protein [Rhodanobacter sp. C06]OOG44968.1 hypothetical protein B0E52_06570 [Rhodanobacter sp. C06]
MHADPKNPKKNPHPVKRYEVTATAEAPGPWDQVKGYISYEVVNPKCTPENKFLGVHIKPTGVGVNIEMTRVGESTWKGYFYRDHMQDEDYYGLGECHWDATDVGVGFTVHGEMFGAGDILEMLLSKGPQTDYFKVSEFMDRTVSGDDAWLTSADDPEVAKHPDQFFPITVAIKEVSP